MGDKEVGEGIHGPWRHTARHSAHVRGENSRKVEK